MRGNFSVRLVHFFLLSFLVFVFTSTGSSETNNYVPRLAVVHRPFGSSTDTLVVVTLADNGRPAARSEQVELWSGHENDNPVTVNVAPVLVTSSNLVIVTEGLLLGQNSKPVMEQLNFTVNPDETLTFLKSRYLRLPKRFMLTSSCSHFEFSQGGHISYVFTEQLTESEGKVVGRIFDPTTSRFGPIVKRHLGPFLRSQFAGCSQLFDGNNQAESQMVAGGNGIVTLEIGGKQITIQIPSGTSISGYEFSRENESSPSLLPTFFYNLVTSRSTGLTSQVFALKYNTFTNQFEGPAKKITKPAVFNRTEPPSLHPVGVTADGKQVVTIGFARGRYDVIDTLVNPVTAGAVKRHVLTYFNPGDVAFSPVIDTSAFSVP